MHEIHTPKNSQVFSTFSLFFFTLLLKDISISFNFDTSKTKLESITSYFLKIWISLKWAMDNSMRKSIYISLSHLLDKLTIRMQAGAQLMHVFKYLYLLFIHSDTFSVYAWCHVIVCKWLCIRLCSDIFNEVPNNS